MERNEQGVVVIIFAALVVLLVLFAALVVDLTVLSSAQEKAQQAARLAALSGLEAYVQLDNTNSAEQVANETIERNRLLSLAKGQLENSVNTGNSLFEWGRYYALSSPDVPSSSCAPCFVLGETPYNALRIRGKLYSNVATPFATNFMGGIKYGLNVDAVATMVPRRIVFLADLSNSILATAIEEGLKAALNEFKERSVVGDQAGMVYFGQTIREEFPLTADFDSLLANAEGFAEGPGATPDDFTNIKIGFVSAMEQFSVANALYGAGALPITLDGIVIVTDGLTNCYMGVNPAPICEDSARFYFTGQQELLDYVEQQVRPSKIAIHVILASQPKILGEPGYPNEGVGPHFLDQHITAEENDGQAVDCPGDDKLRALEPPKEYVMGNRRDGESVLYFGGSGDEENTNQTWWNTEYQKRTLADPNPRQSFFQAGEDMYRLAYITGGQFIPIMQNTATAHTCEITSPPRRVTEGTVSAEDQVVAAMQNIMGLRNSPFRIVSAD